MENLKEMAPLGLTEYGCQQPDAFNLALALEQDCALNMLKEQLITKKGFTPEYAEHALTEYCRFLVLVGIEDQPLSPSPLADECWHQHILNTKAYDLHCKHYFNRFIHHTPVSDVTILEERGIAEYSHELYRTFFGTWQHSAECVTPCQDGAPHCHQCHQCTVH